MGRTKASGTHIRYTHICAKCPDVKVSKVKRRTNLCSTCSRKYAKKKNIDRYYFDLEEFVIRCIPKIRFYKICTNCGKTREVKSKYYAGFGLCAKCNGTSSGKSNKGQVREFVPRPKKEKKKKAKVLSESAKTILKEERAEVNRMLKAQEELPQLDEAESRRMQEEFIRNRNG